MTVLLLRDSHFTTKQRKLPTKGLNMTLIKKSKKFYHINH